MRWFYRLTRAEQVDVLALEAAEQPRKRAPGPDLSEFSTWHGAGP